MSLPTPPSQELVIIWQEECEESIHRHISPHIVPI